MIHLIELYPVLEKWVRNDLEDSFFDPTKITYRVGGEAIALAQYVRCFSTDFLVYMMVDSESLSFLDRTNAKVLEIQKRLPMEVKMLVNDELVDSYPVHHEPISKQQLQLLSSQLNDSIQSDDIVVLLETKGRTKLPLLQAEYLRWRNRTQFLICSFHPYYYPMLRQCAAPVLIVLREHLYALYGEYGKKEILQNVGEIQNQFRKLATLTIVGVSANCIFACKGEEAYWAEYPLQFDCSDSSLEAIGGGLLKCSLKEMNIPFLLETCLSLQVGSSLSGGAYVPSKEVIEKIKGKIIVQKIR